MNYKLSEPAELPDFNWHCPPPSWGFNKEGLFIEPAAETDFWQRTHYGFSADNGHFFHTQARGDFLASATVRLQPRHQYDQAGLMVRSDSDCWMKTSAEFEPGSPSQLGVVVTNGGFSDWSTQDVSAEIDEFSFRVIRQGNEFMVSARFSGQDWSQLRMLRLAVAHTAPLSVGLYACSPKGAGFRCIFTELSLEQASAKK